MPVHKHFLSDVSPSSDLRQVIKDKTVDQSKIKPPVAEIREKSNNC